MVRIKCTNKNKKCNYVWDYRGNAKFYATCPRCLRKVPINEFIEEEVETEHEGGKEE